MSKDEQMYGKLKLPNASFNSFIKELKKQLNNEMEKELSAALKVYNELIKPENKALLKAQLKGTAGHTKGRALYSFVEKRVEKVPELQNRNFDRLFLSQSTEPSYEKVEKITNLLCSRQDDGTYKIKKPNKKQLPLLNKDSSSCIINGEGYLSWNAEEKTVTLSIPEGNRSVESVTSSPEYKAFYNLLLKVDWKKNTGGIFYYDDEYSREADEEHGWHHQMAISKVFGPEEKGVSHYENGVPVSKPIKKRSLTR